jgi:hypothetical protein
MQVIKSLVILVIGCVVITQCKNGNTPFQVSPSEAEQVLQLPPEKQIDAYLSRLRKTDPPNPFLAFVIAPNIDVRKHLQPRIVAEKDDRQARNSRVFPPAVWIGLRVYTALSAITIRRPARSVRHEVTSTWELSSAPLITSLIESSAQIRA